MYFVSVRETQLQCEEFGGAVVSEDLLHGAVDVVVEDLDVVFLEEFDVVLCVGAYVGGPCCDSVVDCYAVWCGEELAHCFCSVP